MMIIFIFFVNNIQVAQLQIASLAEELLSLREGFFYISLWIFFSK